MTKVGLNGLQVFCISLLLRMLFDKPQRQEAFTGTILGNYYDYDA